MMRILHCVASLAPAHGGPTVAVLGMAAAQRALGVDARILSSDDDAGGRLDVRCHEWVEHAGVPVMFLPRVQARQHTLVGFTYTPGYGAWVEAHVKDFDFVHVHTVFSHPANVAMRACRKADVPYCVRPLGQLCQWSLRQRRWIKKIQMALATKENINHARFIHCTSEMEAVETAEAGFRTPCEVLPHGIDLPPMFDDARRELRSMLGLEPDRLVVVFMSRIHPKKGVELLIEAAARLPDLFDLVFVGSGEDSYLDGLKHQAAAALQKRVHWLGFKTGDEKWRILQGADLFVLPSYSENFGIAVLEAIACGLPVIVSDQVALQKEVRDLSLGRVVPLGVGEIANALSSLMASAEERSDIHSRAIACAKERFSWPAAARDLLTAYQRHLTLL